MRFFGFERYLFPLLVAIALTSCAEQFVEEPHSSDDNLPLTVSPTPSFSDGFVGYAALALRRAVNIGWSATKGVSSWCVSETQTQPPLLACEGGQGPDGGWSSTPPDNLLLSPGTGSKLVYTWVRDAGGNLLPMPSVSGVAHYSSSVLIPFSNGSGTAVSDLNGRSFFFSMGSLGSWASNRAIELDGTSSYVDLGVPSELRYTSSFTILTWVKSARAGGQILVGRYDPNTTDRAYHLHFTPSALQFEVSKDGSSSTGMSAVASADYVAKQFQDRWRHVAAVYESKTDGTSRVTLYIDGVKSGESTTGPASILDSSSLKVTIGIAHDLLSYPLKGQVGATAFLPSALSQTLIQAIYAVQKPLY